MITTITNPIWHALLTLLLILSPSSLLTRKTSLTSSLPITSKPIESTAENLAWQAWLMLPPEQKNLEKSRKVTPKSIFTLPFRECPPGHQLFENRCIPTLNIDPTALLHQQLLELIAAGNGNGNANNNYENYDYDDEELVLYDTPQMFSGGINVGGSGISSSSNYDDASQLPSQDEPLKFNIFQQKFPTDYEADMPSSFEGGGSSLPSPQMPQIPQDNHTNTLLQGTEFLEAIRGFMQRHSNETNSSSTSNITKSNTTSIETAINISSKTDTNSNNFADLQSESSNVSANLVASNGFGTTSTTAGTTSSKHSFSVSEIDAIALPAAGNSEHTPHKFSLFKDDSAIQLVTTVISERKNHEETTHSDLEQLLKADALLPLGAAAAALVANIDETTPTTTKTMTLNESAGITTNQQRTEEEVTSMIPDDTEAEVTTTLRSKLSTLLDDAEPMMEAEPEKDEHTRSVTMRSISQEDDTTDFLALQDEFITTLEPDATTNFQLDETTIIEAHDPPAIVLQELQAAADEAAAQHPREQSLVQSSGEGDERRENHIVLMKSKVKPVELVVDTTTATTVPTITTQTSTTKATSISTPLPTVSQSVTATATIPTQDDRFYYQHLVGVGGSSGEDSNQQQRTQISDGKSVGNDDDGGSRSGSTTTTATSEINIEQELRMINELVKGNKPHQLSATMNTTPATRSTIASTATIPTESGFTAETETTGAETERSASHNKATVVADEADVSSTQSSLTTEESGITASATAASSATSDTTAATTTISSTEPNATLWSKIMPILGFGSAAISEVTSSTTTTETAQSPNAEAVEKKLSIGNSSSSSISINSNRSNRNSKISRINSQSANSISDSSTHVASSSEPSKTTTTISVTEEATTNSETTTEISESPDGAEGGGFEPFWWLPIGWRLDRNADDAEKSLLLRFWSAFPGNQAKVKK